MNYHHFTGRDFTFVICAYGECPYLEEAVRSLKRQTVQAKILLSTSTPNDFVRDICAKHDIELRINPEGGQIRDYNFAMAQADTDLVMLMHQDEVLSRYFVEEVLKGLNSVKRPIIAFTDYIEMHNDVPDEKPSRIVKIKRLLLSPMKMPGLGATVFGKRLIQRLGDPITHPSVVCVKAEMPEPVFREQYRASMDWDLWERLSRQEGAFVYIPRVLLRHRMNEDNQTAKLIQTTNARYEEELEIFKRFWPAPVAKAIMHFYSAADKYY